MKLKDIMNFEFDKNKKGSVQIKAVKLLVFFLVAMFLLTIISRAADSVTITRVTTTMASGMAINHDIEAEGNVSSVKDIAVNTVANAKIETVNVEEGKVVEKGDVLITLNQDDLDKLIKEAEKEVKAAEKEIEDKKKAEEEKKKAAQEAKNEAAKARAKAYEDYNDTVDDAQSTLNSAKKAMDSAKKAYDKYKKKKDKTGGVEDSSVEESLAKTQVEKQAAYDKAVEALDGLHKDIEAEVQDTIKAESVDEEGNPIELTQEQKQEIRDRVSNSDKNKELIANAEDKIESCQEELDEAKTAVSEYENEQQILAKQSYSERLAELKTEYETKKSEYEEAKKQYKSTVKEAQRALDDATSSDSSDSSSDDAEDTSSSNEEDESEEDEQGNTLEEKKKALKRVEDLKKAKGEVKAPADGLITRVSAEVGESTSEDAFVRMSDQKSGYVFTASVEKSSAKYLSKGDKISLEFGNGTNVSGLTIGSIEASTNDKDSYEVKVSIPEKVKKITTVATMKVEKASKKYDTCVPLACLHSDGNDYYVYTVSESNTVLGIENKVDKVSVNILDKNSEYAAIEGSFSGYDDKFVLSASKTLNDKDRVKITENKEGSDEDDDDDEGDD